MKRRPLSIDDVAIPAEDFQDFIDSLSKESRVHLDVLIRLLAQCYGDDPPLQGLLLLGAPSSDTFTLMSLNCTEIAAAQLLDAAMEAVGYINTKDAPPKEMFN